MRTPVNARAVATRGRAEIARELERHGWAVREVGEGRLRLLDALAPDGRHVQLRVKAKTGGAWQASISSGAEAPRPRPVRTFWAFIDLGTTPHETFIVPDDWMRQNIFAAHREYVERNGGHRPVNDASLHHSIEAERIEQWRRRWDLLDAHIPTRTDS